MSLGEAVAALRTRTLGELDAAEQYFQDTEKAWRLIEQLAIAKPGGAISPGAFPFPTPPGIDAVISTVRTDLTTMAAKANGYIAGYLAEATFQQSLATFEAFVADLLTAWLVAHPAALGDREVSLTAVLRDGVQTVVAAQAARVVRDALFGPPARWFKTLNRHARIGRPSADQITRFAEAKATRDLLVHNRGIANPVYLAKAGASARCRDGERIDLPEPYRREVWELVRQLVTDLSDAVLAKLASDLPPPAPPG